ncbi:hypothetical protein S83_067066, partial [Arachis hypogaea]
PQPSSSKKLVGNLHSAVRVVVAVVELYVAGICIMKFHRSSHHRAASPRQAMASQVLS